MDNIVTEILTTKFDGNYTHMGSAFGVSPMAVRKWEIAGEFPAKNGRMQQAHELTGIEYKKLTPSAFKSPPEFKSRLMKFQRIA